ncbi:MAG: hypothetical protein KGI27_13395 [Thaumarchaeota archaeon]|nr:hypothetical protein [Nitrososphaerota archaeon]
MGTDIYLNWNKKSEIESEEQMTGFSIDAGRVGYLRASIGMVAENELLRAVFPIELWEGSEDIKPFDFKGHYERTLNIGIRYLLGLPITLEEKAFENLQKQVAMGSAVKKMVDKMGFENTMLNDDSSDIRSRVMFINSVWSFFELGMEKQEAGLEPVVEISW